MKGQKIPPYIGEDGRLYFNFGVELRALCREKSADGKIEKYTFEIKACRLVGDTEYYEATRNTIPLPQLITANRVKYILTWYGIKTLSVGVRAPLPLTINEIEQYSEYCAERQRSAEQTLATNERFTEVEQSLRRLSMQLGFAEARGQADEEKKLIQQQLDLNKRKSEIMRDLGISEEALAGVPFCAKCNHKGYIGHELCMCTAKYAEEIQNYCANLRLRIKKFTA